MGRANRIYVNDQGNPAMFGGMGFGQGMFGGPPTWNQNSGMFGGPGGGFGGTRDYMGQVGNPMQMMNFRSSMPSRPLLNRTPYENRGVGPLPPFMGSENNPFNQILERNPRYIPNDRGQLNAQGEFMRQVSPMRNPFLQGQPMSRNNMEYDFNPQQLANRQAQQRFNPGWMMGMLEQNPFLSALSTNPTSYPNIPYNIMDSMRQHYSNR